MHMQDSKAEKTLIIIQKQKIIDKQKVTDQLDIK